MGHQTLGGEVLGAGRTRKRDGPNVPGGKWDLKDFGECFSESCKPRGGGQDTTSFPSLVCAVLITFSSKSL